MELKIQEYQLPNKILFNYEELKAAVTEAVAADATTVITEEQIKFGKERKAQLNKFRKVMNDERIRLEKEYMLPFNEFKDKVNDLISIIDKATLNIDIQLKGYEDKRKQDKMNEIKALWTEMEVPDGLTFEKVFEERMLNVSYGMNHVKQKMLDDIKRFNRDLETLSNLPEFGFEAVEVYKSTLDINKAIAEAKRMSEIAKKKAEQEAEARARAEEQARLAAEAEAKKIHEEEAQFATEIIANGVPTTHIAPAEPVKPAKQWVSFSALLSTEDAVALKEFFNSRNIEFRAV